MVGIGNSLGKHLKMDLEQDWVGMDTYACTCVEVDLSKGFPNNFILSGIIRNGFNYWTIKI